MAPRILCVTIAVSHVVYAPQLLWPRDLFVYATLTVDTRNIKCGSIGVSVWRALQIWLHSQPIDYTSSTQEISHLFRHSSVNKGVPLGYYPILALRVVIDMNDLAGRHDNS